MLDDDEFKHAISLRGAGQGDLRERQFAPVLAEYERITGYRETNINGPLSPPDLAVRAAV
jgi:hypothetical protein